MAENEQPAGRSYALLIATDRYEDPALGQLRSPSHDAEELAKVLRDPAVGGFDTATLINKPTQLLLEEIEGFFADRHRADLLVFYASCHGVKNPSGRLYFVASTTKLNLLASTGISAEFLYEQVDRCRARRILVLLDCCYSGSYAKGHLPKAGEQVGIGLHEGQGRAAISSSTAEEYSFEEGTGKVPGKAGPSFFTAALVKGLGTGAADVDGDGLVSVDDLYAYVKAQVSETIRNQTPELKWGDIRGDFIIARNPNPPKARPEPLPATLLDALNNPYAEVRQGTITALVRLARGDNGGMATTALEKLRELRDDDSRLVSAAAEAALTEFQAPAASSERIPPAASKPAGGKTRWHRDTGINDRSITNRRGHLIYFLVSALLVATGFGLAVVIPMIFFIRNRAIRMNVILALEVTFLFDAGLALTIVGGAYINHVIVGNVPLGIGLLIPGALGLAAFLVTLPFCIVQIRRRRQPVIPVLTRAAHRLAYGNTEAPWPVRGTPSARLTKYSRDDLGSRLRAHHPEREEGPE
jgi:hypothetical protein